MLRKQKLGLRETKFEKNSFKATKSFINKIFYVIFVSDSIKILIRLMLQKQLSHPQLLLFLELRPNDVFAQIYAIDKMTTDYKSPKLIKNFHYQDLV